MKLRIRVMILMMVAIILGCSPIVTVYAETEIYEDNLEDTIMDIALGCKLHETNFNLYYLNSCADVSLTMMKMYFFNLPLIDVAETKIPDYYMLNVHLTSWDAEETYDETKGYYLVRFDASYRETVEQTAFVIKRVKQIIKENKKSLSKLTDAKKYEWIYSYIIEHFDYDDSLGNDTAYEGITEGTMTCVGYAGLYYIMAIYMGLPCKITYGIVNTGASHVWNLAKLDNKWYYVDATWGENGYESFLLAAPESLECSHTMNKRMLKDIDKDTGKAIVIATKDYYEK